MAGLRDPFRYREEAAHFREQAAAATDSRLLRDSYLALAIEFERLADVLEQVLKRRGSAQVMRMTSPIPRPTTTIPRKRPPGAAMIGMGPKPHQPLAPKGRD